MSDPKRLAEAPATPSDHVVARAASVEPRALKPGGWSEVMKQASRKPSRALPLIAVSAASVVTGVGLAVLATDVPEPSAPVVAKVAPEIQPESGAVWTRDSGDELRLTTGRLQVNRDSARPLTLTASDDVTIQTSRARFLADVTEDGVTVFVQDGEVQVRTPRGLTTVRAGETFAWPPEPEIPSQLMSEQTEAESDCGEQTACLEVGAASADELEAEVSLFELGLVRAKQGDREGALSAWRDSLSRFPDGALHPEVRLALLRELIRARRFGAASTVAREFERACSDDPRRAQVEALRTSLKPAP